MSVIGFINPGVCLKRCEREFATLLLLLAVLLYCITEVLFA